MLVGLFGLGRVRVNKFLRRREQSEFFRRFAVRPFRPVEAVEMVAANFVFLQHDGDGFLLVNRRPPVAAAFGVSGQCLLQLMRQAEIIHHQAARLVLENAVHAGDGLHQPVAAHGLVQIHGMQTGASKPVSHISRTMTILNGSSPFLNRFASASRRGLLRM